MDAVDPKIQSCFPEIIGPQDKLGMLRPEVAKQLGLPQNVIVSAGE